MDLVALKSEIESDPLGYGYSGFLPDQPGHVVDKLNASSATCIKSRYVTVRTILAECPNGLAILDKFEAAASSVSAIKWAMVFLSQNSGLDVGHPTTRTLMGGLVQAGIITSGEAEELKNMALAPCSRAEQLGLSPVSMQDLFDSGVL